jgi:hypothetical protein
MYVLKTPLLDIQIWMGFCCYYGHDDGGIHGVHCEDYFVEVSSRRFSWSDGGSSPLFFILKNRAKFRREANQADNKAATVAVDSLINFEAVKVRKSLATPSHSEDNEDGNHFRLVALQQREI